ncbi:MAG: hypothetical protein ACYCSR_16585, partial [Thiomonas sp.]
QVRAVLGARSLRGAPWQRATEHVVSLVLRGCGLGALAAGTAPSRAAGGLHTPAAPHPSPPRLRGGSKTSRQV